MCIYINRSNEAKHELKLPEKQGLKKLELLGKYSDFFWNIKQPLKKLMLAFE